MVSASISFTLRAEYYNALKKHGLSPATTARLACERAAKKLYQSEAVELLKTEQIQG